MDCLFQIILKLLGYNELMWLQIDPYVTFILLG